VPTNTSNTYQLTKVQGGAGYDYSVLVTNTTNGCTNTAVVNVADNKVLPTQTLAATNNTICSPAANYNGKVVSTVTNQIGAITDYTFTFGPAGGTQGTSPNHNVYDKLNGGITYTSVTTHTVTGCVSSTASVAVLNVQNFPVLTTGNTGSTNCVAGKEDGKATVLSVDGAAAPGANYTYAWTGPAAFPVTVATNTSNTYQLTKVQGGAGYSYSVLVTNTTNGCTNTTVVNVADAKVLPTQTLATTNNTICSPAANYNGKVVSTVTNQIGAITDYTFTFAPAGGTQVTSPNHNVYDKLNGGITYTSVATHTVTGCISSTASVAVLNVQSFPVLTTGNTGSTNCVAGKEDGKATVLTVDGVAAPGANYTYAWTGPAAFSVTVATNTSNTFQLTQVQGGAGYDYSVLVTNTTNGCTNTAVVNVADVKVLPLLNLIRQNNSICDLVKATLGPGTFDGQIQAGVSNIPGGGTVNDYFFDWSVGTDGNGVTLLPGLDVGSYSVTALHNPTGCQSSSYSMQVLGVKQFPSIAVQQSPSTNCSGGMANGTAFVTSVLPAGKTYDYKWYDGNTASGIVKDTDANYQNVQGGSSGASLLSYTVDVVILETGCENTATVGVSDDSQVPVLGALTPTDNTRCIGADGSATVTTVSYRGAAQVAPYTGFTFAWSNGDNGFTTTTPLAAGTYTLSVKNDNDNCFSNPVPVTIKDKLFIPPIIVTDVDQGSCDPLNPTGELTAAIDETSIGGAAAVTAGYTLTWVDNVTAAIIPNTNGLITQLKGKQNYTITAVRTATQCSNSQTVYLNETLVLPVVNVAAANMTTCSPLNGSLTASIAAAGNYTYYWYNGNNAADEDYVITNNNFSAVNNGLYAGLAPGNYTVVAQNNATKCNSSQVIKSVADASPAINIAVTNVALPTTCGATNSEMDATANGVVAGYTFTWYNGVPVNAGAPDYFTNPPVFNPPGALGIGDKLFGQTDGLYSVEVTDNSTGCKNLLPNTLPFQNSHAVIKITKTNSTICPYATGNGSIEIEIFNPALPPPPPGTDETSYFVSLTQGATTIVAPYHPGVATGSFLVSNTLAPGSYTLGVQETYSASKCYIYEDVIIGADALPPVITLASSIISNSACGVAGYDGQIAIHVDKDPKDLTAGTTYDIDMSPDPNGVFPLAGQSAGNYPASSLGPDDYTFTATASTGCSTTKTFTVQDKPAVAELVAANISVFSAEYCDAAKEQSAKITIDQIGIANGPADVLDNYQFNWYDNAALAAPIFTQQGDPTAAKGGEELSNVAPLPSVNVTDQSYWVVATKTANASALGGVGCTSAPYKIDIPNHKVKPLITLTPFSNTACDGNFE
jgi:hypothetical protein